MPRILIIDDDETFRSLLFLSLKNMGHEVTEASNGVEAIHALEAQTPDLVMTDLIMPDKEGLETIREARKRWPEIRIIAMSGGGLIKASDFLKIAQSLGAVASLEKPFTNEELDTVIKEALSRPQPPRST